jgi:DNA adenine methylase
VEVLNDLDFDIVNFFRVCQWHYQELIRYLRFSLVSRKLHELRQATNPAALTDIQRAGQFFYLQKNSFGGLIVRQKFHYGVIQPSNYNPERIPEVIEAAHRRLARVQVESLPYQQVLEEYDRPTTVFYLDPPYWERKLYKFNFTESDFYEMEKLLTGLKGKFILSLDDRPEVRAVFAKFRMQTVELAYTAKRDTSTRHKELFITNFDP